MRVVRILIMTLPLVACASLRPGPAQAPTVRQHLDETTAVTVTSGSSTSSLVREESWTSAHGREVIDAGLVEINRSGQHQWLLRLAVWSTLDLAGQAERRNRLFQKILLLADGEPIELSPSAWSDRQAGLSDPPYPVPVEEALVVYLPVTRGQAERFASAREVSIIADPAGEALEYMLRKPESTARAEFTRYLREPVRSVPETVTTTNHRE